jgi:hypothetical protein
MVTKSSKKLNKTALIAIVLVVVFAVGFGVGLHFLLQQNKGLRHLYENEQIRIKILGEELGTFTFAELEELVPLEEFTAVFKPSGRPAIERTYLGIEVRKLLIALNVDFSQFAGISFMPADGRQSVFSREQIMKENDVFIAVQYGDKVFQRGISLSSTYPEEDGGPFVVIIASDPFSMNRVRALVEIDIL